MTFRLTLANSRKRGRPSRNNEPAINQHPDKADKPSEACFMDEIGGSLSASLLLRTHNPPFFLLYVHYYDQVSPMVGIALLLYPTFKKSSLVDMFDWKEEWVDAVEESFVDAFRVYKSKVDISENI